MNWIELGMICKRSLTNLHFPESVSQKSRRLIGDKVSGFDQPLTGSHEVRWKLTRINPVLSPTSDPVSNANDVSWIVGTSGSKSGWPAKQDKELYWLNYWVWIKVDVAGNWTTQQGGISPHWEAPGGLSCRIVFVCFVVCFDGAQKKDKMVK